MDIVSRLQTRLSFLMHTIKKKKGKDKKKSTNCFVINLSSGDQDVGNTRCPIVWIKNLNNNIRKKKIK